MGEPVFDYSKLRGRIKEIFGTQDNFAKALNLGKTALSQKLNNKSEFETNEIFKAIRLLDLDDSDIQAYFFTVKVQKQEQNS